MHFTEYSLSPLFFLPIADRFTLCQPKTFYSSDETNFSITEMRTKDRTLCSAKHIILSYWDPWAEQIYSGCTLVPTQQAWGGGGIKSVCIFVLAVLSHTSQSNMTMRLFMSLNFSLNNSISQGRCQRQVHTKIWELYICTECICKEALHRRLNPSQ